MLARPLPLDRLSSTPAARATAPVALAFTAEPDIARARRAARELCEAEGLEAVTLQRVVTIASELARNMVRYAGGGHMSITAEPRSIVIVARDTGPGIRELDAILAGRFRSRTSNGLGLLGSKRLSDSFTVQTGAGGTCVTAEVHR